MPNLSNTVTFLFAGDGSLASDGLSAFLQTKSNFLLSSECSDGVSTIAEIRSQRPEIAVIDAQLPDMSALEIVKAVRADNRETKIIILGASADRNIAVELLTTGADAYIVRSGPSRHLNDAIRYVRDGGKYLAPQLTKDLPAPAIAVPAESHGEAFTSLRAAVEAQALTVQRLEHAMDRAQCAIELLQHRLEELTGMPVEPATPAPSDDSERGRKMPGIRTSMRTVAAALVVGVLGFQLAGILQPAHAVQAGKSANSATADTTDATMPISMTRWEWENVEKARSLLKGQQYGAAEKLCRTVLQKNPANSAASKILASSLFHQNRVSESADVLRSIAIPTTRVSRMP